MTIKNARLQKALADLQANKEKLAGDQGTKDTSHPTASVPNSTKETTTGARASENTADVKDQQPVGVENTGGPVDRKNPSGSMGVEDKKPDEGAAMDTGNTSGKSEMGGKDTTHPIKNAEDVLTKAAAAIELLTKAIAEADAAEKVAADKAAADKAAADKAGTDKTAAEKEAAEKAALAKYAQELEQQHPEAVKAGEKFAEHVLGLLAKSAEEQEKQAAAMFERQAVLKHILKTAAGEGADEAGLDQAAGELAQQGVSPEELEGALADNAAGAGNPEDINPEELIAALEQAGVTPEDLQAALAGDAAPADAGAGLSPDEQMGALDSAMTETGTTPGDIQAAGGQVPEGTVGKAASIKLSADKAAAWTTYRNQLVAELKALKGAGK